ncbi:hypothetical protein [Cellulomonas dongxiuzhuiae]|uniref:Glycosyltransferase RgtA/B/C/D-like domain-containing protein n=1 Tax=Cellulomonas dongxiuzhuiae TaxID=2819979 RepID=A0ABX8GL75_9CELL|nr:hypothetical protein [Cellulomonas dongxiuzhuiae]MBO3096488.1 hypothetical protein [Cellulomonas dongxiuzhuiae]QWC16884.1 hypothetical protein KKR89_04440 [Cellulomonas dongxiuzhuiae]
MFAQLLRGVRLAAESGSLPDEPRGDTTLVRAAPVARGDAAPVSRRDLVRRSAVLVVAYLVSRVAVLGAIAVATRQQDLDRSRAFAPWDGPFYVAIAEQGYPDAIPEPGQGHLSTAAFFPLFPLLVRGLSELTGAPVVATGIPARRSGMPTTSGRTACRAHNFSPVRVPLVAPHCAVCACVR